MSVLLSVVISAAVTQITRWPAALSFWSNNICFHRTKASVSNCGFWKMSCNLTATTSTVKYNWLYWGEITELVPLNSHPSSSKFFATNNICLHQTPSLSLDSICLLIHHSFGWCQRSATPASRRWATLHDWLQHHNRHGAVAVAGALVGCPWSHHPLLPCGWAKQGDWVYPCGAGHLPQSHQRHQDQESRTSGRGLLPVHIWRVPHWAARGEDLPLCLEYDF